jgi:hypothetical protein
MVTHPTRVADLLTEVARREAALGGHEGGRFGRL